jgi:hypothetical protein
MKKRMGRCRVVALAGAAIVAGCLALPGSASAVTGWHCTASALSGSALGQSLPGAVTTGSTTADCTPGTAVPTLSVPSLLDLQTLTATTAVDGLNVSATGGAGDLTVHVLPGLPVKLPPVTIPDALTRITLPGLPGLGDVVVDLTPAIQAALPNRQLPTLDLVHVAGALATATGQCQSGNAVLGGSTQVGEVSILGQPVGEGLVSKALTLLDSGSIDLTKLDLSLAKVTIGGTTVPVDASLLSVITGPLLAALPVQSIAIPATVAQVKVTPGEQTTTATSLTQRALRVQASIAGQSIADLSVGSATIVRDGVQCGANGVLPETASSLTLQCSKRRIVLIDVLQRGRRVKLLGAADKRYVGRKVALVFAVGHKTVAHAKVRRDGSFSAMAPMPAAKYVGTNKARYRAVLGSDRSLNLKLTRRMIVESVRSSKGKVHISGRVTGPLADPVRTITVKRRVTCKKTVTVAHVRPSSSGRFSVTVKAPKNHTAAVYRLQTAVRHKVFLPRLYPTFTLPRAVDL